MKVFSKVVNYLEQASERGVYRLKFGNTSGRKYVTGILMSELESRVVTVMHIFEH